MQNANSTVMPLLKMLSRKLLFVHIGLFQSSMANIGSGLGYTGSCTTYALTKPFVAVGTEKRQTSSLHKSPHAATLLASKTSWDSILMTRLCKKLLKNFPSRIAKP